MGYQMQMSLEKILTKYPFVEVGIFEKKPWEKLNKRGKTPRYKDYCISFAPFDDDCLEICKFPGVYILSHSYNYDFYVGHTETGFNKRKAKYISGLNTARKLLDEDKDPDSDTNSRIAQHIFSHPHKVFFLPNPTAEYFGRKLYIGESIETEIIKTFNPILNIRNH